MRVISFSTYNRLPYLKEAIETWDATRNKNVKWCLIVADDGSNDGTKEYLQDLFIEDIEFYYIPNRRRGVHYQKNSIIKLCSELDFDVAFISDDDVVFKKSGWDDNYVNAIKITKKQHLVYNDVERLRRRKSFGEKYKDKYLQSYVGDITDVQGAFFTITPEIIKNVGYYNTKDYNLWAYGHTDYTIRCCVAGYNNINHCCDIADSNDYIALQTDSYKTSENRRPDLWNTREIIKDKKNKLIRSMQNDNVYVEYNYPKVNIEGVSLPYKTAFITANKDRDILCGEMTDNILRIFNGNDYEIIIVTQADSDRFKRGQLLNIGVLNTDAEMLVLLDNDIRFFDEIKFSEIVCENPLVLFKQITQIDKDGNELFVKRHPFGFGGLNLFTRSQFIKSCGYSNLFIGWGGEDNCMHKRASYKRLDYKIGHIYHGEERDFNKERFDLVKSFDNRSKFYDGYLHAIYDADGEQIDENIKYIDVKNIRTPENFKYKEMIK